MVARWRTDDIKRIFSVLKVAFIAALVLGVLLIIMLSPETKVMTILATALALWIIISTVISMLQRTRNSSQTGIRRILALPAAYMGMSLAHIGFALCIIGVSITSHYSSEIHRRMGVGDIESLSGYQFELMSVEEVEGPNYFATEAVFNIHRNDDVVTTLVTQKRFYPVAGSTMTEAGIGGNLFRDLYVSLGEELDNGDWSISIYFRPFVRWMWFGALFMAIGGFIAASDKRYRYKMRRTEDIGLGTATVNTPARG